jgi:hypothetical protein
MAYMNCAFSIISFVHLVIDYKLAKIIFANSLYGATNDFIGNIYGLTVH